MNNTVIVFKPGAWDPFHVGHLNVIRMAAGFGERLIVGVATDDYIREYKHREPFLPFCDRARIVSELRSVDLATPYSGPEDMVPIDLFGINVVVVDEFYGIGNSTHAKRQRLAIELLRMRHVRIVRVPRTPNVSSTRVREGGTDG